MSGNDWAGPVFIGCLMVGIGLGIYLNEVTVGTLVGMGVGFLAQYIAGESKSAKKGKA